MRTLYLLALVLLIGCQSQTNKKIETNETINKIDSIINHSEKLLQPLIKQVQKVIAQLTKK